jgi:hypothetical protein
MLLEAGANSRQIFKAEKLLYSARRTTGSIMIDGKWRPYDKETFVACFTGNKEILELLLQSGVSANDNFDESTLLVAAASSHRKDAVSEG